MNCILDWWYRRLRRIDMDILWPECVAQAPDLDHARAAFAVHAYLDRAWKVLGDEEIDKLIDQLGR